MQSPRSLLAILILSITLAGNSPEKITTQAGDTAFANVNVLPMTQDTVLTDQTVIVRDGKIWKIGPSAATQLDVFEELVRTARASNITFSGHVPMDVGIVRAIDFKYASIDHLDGYIDGLLAPREFFPAKRKKNLQ